jgi:hypothetical protein
MDFIDRKEELDRLDRLAESADGGLAVLYGRRRIGKTRLLLEWSRRQDGLYTVADQSAPEIQRRYFAEAVARRLPGFADVDYRDWRGLLERLARESRGQGFRGPVIFDELPYLVVASPEMPSVLQRWIDHEAREARLVVAVAGSSQRMMQGLVLSRDAPLFGRANEILELGPIDPVYLHEVFHPRDGIELVETFTAWGGVPRYWELAAPLRGGVDARLERLVLDPMGPLHREPDRLLLEEVPSALETRPVLDAIGAGVHRVSEIGGRLGRPATSMSRPLDRLVEMGLVRREVPFGESEKKTRRALYKIDDPFFRLWFRVVAPHRGQLAASTRAARLQLLERLWKDLAAQAWEDLCRQRLPYLGDETVLGRLGPWGPAARWWKGASAEWDVVSESLDRRRVLVGEARWSAQPFTARDLERFVHEVEARTPPELSGRLASRELVRVVFVPERGREAPRSETLVVTAMELIPSVE